MMGLSRVEARNRVSSYVSSLTHQAQLVLAQCSDTLNPAQQRRLAESQQSAPTQSVLARA